MNHEQIKVGFCVAYDWQLLRYSLPLIYLRADVICISVDKDRITWAGNKFELDEAGFLSFLKDIDPLEKIQLLEEKYFGDGLSPAENEVNQRRRIAQHLGAGGWHIQLDCDEYFLNFDGFVSFLRRLTPRRTRRSNVVCLLVTLYKKTESGFLYILPGKNADEFIQIASREPAYEHGRRNGNFNIITDFVILHQSWARNEVDVMEKLRNWGHLHDFDIDAYFGKWKAINESNFREQKNFHPIHPEKWASLEYLPSTDESRLIGDPPAVQFPFSRFGLWIRNNRNISRVRSVFRKLR